MPRGHWKRRTVEIDYRQILALLPGRLIVKQLVDREIALIRQTLKAGRHPEYLALLPGLEMEEQRIAGDLGNMADLMQPAAGGDGKGDGTGGVRLVSQQPLLEAPQEQGPKTLDVSRLLPLPFTRGKPISAWLMLKELMEHGEFSRREFIAKHGAMRPTLRGSGMSIALGVLRRCGVKMKLPPGRVILVSKLTGELPTAPYRQTGKAASEVAKPLKKTPVPKTVAKGAYNKAPGGLNQAQFLIRAFEESPGHIIDISTLWKQMGAASYASAQVAVTQLRTKRGLNIVTLGDHRYRMVTKKGSKA